MFAKVKNFLHDVKLWFITRFTNKISEQNQAYLDNTFKEELDRRDPDELDLDLIWDIQKGGKQFGKGNMIVISDKHDDKIAKINKEISKKPKAKPLPVPNENKKDFWLEVSKQYFKNKIN